MIGSGPEERLIVALDMDAHQAFGFARMLGGRVRWLKVGMTLFYDEGPDVVRRLTEHGYDVFLDLKLHDIPHQVEGAARTLGRLGARMLTVHAAGGAAMIESAVAGARAGAAEAGLPAPAVLAVTVLTSMNETVLRSVGINHGVTEQVEVLGRVAHAAGADGVVCSPHEAALMREVMGERAIVVTPGVRPSGSHALDQSRTARPASAIRAGASHIVVGRPVTGAATPVEAVERIVREMEDALS